jgi:diguanylate cyclase (GGDEF)-like protein
MFIDLDKFKEINDSHGHSAGDAAIAAVGTRLLECAREEDTVCRAGGDEFLFLLVNPGGIEQVRRVASRIAACVAEPLVHGDLALTITPSIGVAMYPEHGVSVAELVDHADAAMYVAKAGATGVEIFAGDTGA